MRRLTFPLLPFALLPLALLTVGCSMQREPALGTPWIPPQPVAFQQATYVVQPGDSLADIASRYETTIEALAEPNGIVAAAVLEIGQVLVLPGVVEGDEEQLAAPRPRPNNVTPPVPVFTPLQRDLALFGVFAAGAIGVSGYAITKLEYGMRRGAVRSAPYVARGAVRGGRGARAAARALAYGTWLAV